MAGIPTHKTISSPGKPTREVTGTDFGTDKRALDVHARSFASNFDGDSVFAFNITTAAVSDTHHLSDALELTNIFSENGRGGLFMGAILSDDGKIEGDFDVLLFAGEPTLISSLGANVLDFAESEVDKIVGRFEVRLGHWRPISGHSIAVVPFTPPPPFAGPQWVQPKSNETSLWALLQAKSSFTPANAADIRMKLIVKE